MIRLIATDMDGTLQKKICPVRCRSFYRNCIAVTLCLPLQAEDPALH